MLGRRSSGRGGAATSAAGFGVFDLDALSARGRRGGRIVMRVAALLRAPLDAGVGDGGGDELDRADRVIVSGDHIIDEIGIAVGVGKSDDRDAELTALFDGDMLERRIDHEERLRTTRHILDAAEEFREALGLAADAEGFLLGETIERAVLGHLIDLAETIETDLHRREVRERAAEPAVGDVELIRALRLFGDDLGRLTLRPDKEDIPSASDGADDEIVRLFKEADGLIEVDDMDAVARPVDITGHLRVPAMS